MQIQMRAWKGVLALLLAFVALPACEEAEQQRISTAEFLAAREAIPVSESFDVEYRYTVNGQLKAVMDAPHILERLKPMEAEERENIAEDIENPIGSDPQINYQTFSLADSGIDVQFFTPQGTPDSRLTANWAKLYEGGNFAEAQGNVRVRNAEGHIMETEQLFWDQRRDQIFTPRFVKITTPEEIIMGDSMVSNTSFSKYRIYRIRGTIRLRE